MNKIYTLALLLLLVLKTGYVQSQTSPIEFERKERTDNVLPPASDVFYKHVIQMNGRSHAINPGDDNNYFSKECYAENCAFFDMHLKAIFDNINEVMKHKKIKLMFFIHGGLNGTGSALDKAYNDYLDINDYNKHRLMMNPDDTIIYPIFINWNTGAVSSVAQHYSVIRNGERLNPLSGWFKHTTRFLGLLVSGTTMLAVDLSTGALKIPFYYGEGFWGSRDGMFKNHRKYLAKYYIEAINAGVDVRDTNAFRKLKGNGWRIFGNKTLFVSAQLTGGVTYPIVNGWGTSAWQNMSRRVLCMYRNNEQFYKEKHLNNCLIKTGLPDEFKHHDYNENLNGPMALLFKRFNTFAAENSNTQLHIDFIGHSMGTMVWNEGFRVFGNELLANNNIHIDNIVYMGAACSMKDWETSVGHILKNSKQTQFYNLSLHPKREKQECFFPVLVAPGSLLEWIDRLYEGPASFEDRTLGKYENILTANSILNNSYKSQIHIKCFGYAYTSDEIKNMPVKHGGFRKKQYWRPEFWK